MTEDQADLLIYAIALLTEVTAVGIYHTLPSGESTQDIMPIINRTRALIASVLPTHLERSEGDK